MMFKGEKTRVFWWGLVISGLCICILFSIFWYFFVLYSFDWRYWAPEVFGSVIFLLIGLYMMKAGTKKTNQVKPNRNSYC